MPEPVEEPAPVTTTKAVTFEDAVTYFTATKKIEFSENTAGLNEHYFRHLRAFLVSKGRTDIALKDISSKLMFEFFDTTTVGARFRNGIARLL